MENAMLVIIVGLSLFILVALMAPSLKMFIGEAQQGAGYSEGLVWAIVLPVIFLSVGWFMVKFYNPGYG